jgi:hypothetical protein
METWQYHHARRLQFDSQIARSTKLYTKAGRGIDFTIAVDPNHNHVVAMAQIGNAPVVRYQVLLKMLQAEQRSSVVSHVLPHGAGFELLPAGQNFLPVWSQSGIISVFTYQIDIL